jgi:predicted secreted Zn-dependent protease
MTIHYRNNRYVVFCLVLTLGACATSHPENPSLDAFPAGVAGSTDLVYYDVHGSTARELVADMRKVGPKSADGGVFFGETQSPLRWTWRTRSSSGMCSPVDIRVQVSAQITLPRWTPPADTVPGLLAQWNQFLAALEVHEVGHKDISGRAAADVIHKLTGLNTFCSSLNDEARRITDGIVARLRDDQVRYDADTRHGLTQGAVFPPRRALPPAPARMPGLVRRAAAFYSRSKFSRQARRATTGLRSDVSFSALG